MMRVIVDADLIIEWIVQWIVEINNLKEDTNKFLNMIVLQQIEAHITEVGLDRLRNYCRFLVDETTVVEITYSLLDIINVWDTSDSIFDTAMKLNIFDLDSRIEVAYANEKKLHVLITNNPQKYIGATISVLTPEKFLKIQALEIMMVNNQ